MKALLKSFLKYFTKNIKEGNGRIYKKVKLSFHCLICYTTPQDMTSLKTKKLYLFNFKVYK